MTWQGRGYGGRARPWRKAFAWVKEHEGTSRVCVCVCVCVCVWVCVCVSACSGRAQSCLILL